MEEPEGLASGSTEEKEVMKHLGLLPRILVVLRISVKILVTIRRR
jgi:hypothetical protein